MNKKQSTLFASYTPSSCWELEFDVNKCQDWYIRWDTLFCRFDEGADYIEFEPSVKASDDVYAFKDPIRVKIL